MVKCQTSRQSPSPSTAELRSKLLRIFSRHEQMKLTFHHLKSQIKIVLLEAGDVFESLAIPLMRLVGLKTMEMAKEGRFSSIVMDIDVNSEGSWRNEIRLKKTHLNSPCANHRGDEAHQIHEMDELV